MITNTEGYGRAQGEGDLQRLGEIEGESFSFPAADAPTWFTRTGVENVRVYRQGGAVVAGLLLIPMGQFWGGRPVRHGGFAGVAVAPHARGGGAATRMMAEGLRDLRQQGFPLAGLYPATQPLYRRVGFEQAGGRFELRGPVSALPPGSRDLPVRPFVPADLPEVQRLYSELARTRHGWLDRGPYVWSRVQAPRGHTVFGYVVLGERGGIEGYTFLARTNKPNARHDLLVTDLAARSPAGWQRLLAFFGDHGSMAEEIVWFGGADDPLLLLMREQRFTAHSHESWMIRVLDVPAALTARGYPAGLTARLGFQVEDDLFPENAGAWVLEVSGGEGRVHRGGEDDLRCHVRTLATLYSGHRSATELAGLGLLTASPRALETADALFAARAPSMRDMY